MKTKEKKYHMVNKICCTCKIGEICFHFDAKTNIKRTLQYMSELYI